MSEFGDGLSSQHGASSEDVAALYEKWTASGTYDDDMVQWGYEAPERVAELVSTALDGAAGGTVLDAGCGTGRLGAALRALGVDDVWGGDFSPTSVEVAGAGGHYTDVGHLDLNAPLEFDDGRFAATASVGVFSYVTDIESALHELLRIVQPGGVVIFTQRTDLWDDRDGAGVIARLDDSGLCTSRVSAPMPYLPGHPDFGATIGIRYVTLTR